MSNQSYKYKKMNTKLKTIGILLISMIGMLLLFISIVGIGNYFQKNINNTIGNLILMSFSVIVYFAVIFFNKNINKLSASHIGFYFDGFIKSSLLGIGLAIGIMGAVIIVASIFFGIQFEFISLKVDFGMSLIDLLSTFLVVGLWEEFYFRGLMFNTLLKNKFGFHLSAILSAFLFSVIHFESFDMSTTSWLWYVGIVLIGYLLAYLYSYTKSTWSVVSFHLFWNMLATLIDANKNAIGLFQITNFTEHSKTIDNLIVIVLAIIMILIVFYQKKKTFFSQKIKSYIYQIETSTLV